MQELLVGNIRNVQAEETFCVLLFRFTVNSSFSALGPGIVTYLYFMEVTDIFFIC